MSLRNVRRTWERFGSTDPLWAILTHDEKRGGGWDLKEFLQTGVDEVQALFTHLESVRPGFAPRNALDFGCGVGRLSQALAGRVLDVHGVDIANSMIERAREIERSRTEADTRLGSCTFHCNSASDLTLFESGRFDLIYSNITLQHMPPPLQDAYLAEFTRVLSDDGLLVFQLPEAPRRPLNWRGRRLRPLAVAWSRFVRRRPVMDMFGQDRERVVETLERHGGRLLVVENDPWCGPDWVGVRYTAARVT